MVTLEALVHSLNARVACEGAGLGTEISEVYAGDKMSDLLEHAGRNTLIVTGLANAQLLRVAELMDLSAICLIAGLEPAAVLVDSAAHTGTALIVSPHGLFETCGRLYRVVVPGGAEP